MSELKEKATWSAHATLDKYDDDGNLIETIEIEDANLLVNVGINLLEANLVTAAGTLWDNDSVGIGVGDSATAEAATDTDLNAVTNKHYKAMVASYPQQGTQKMTFRAEFLTGEANFAWQEYGVVVCNTATAFANGTSKPANGVLLNHKTASLGTKSSGTWTLTVEITIA